MGLWPVGVNVGGTFTAGGLAFEVFGHSTLEGSLVFT